MSLTLKASVAGILTGLALCVAFVVFGVVERPPPPPDPALSADRHVEFVADFRRSRSTTYRMISKFRREMTSGGGVLVSEREVVQRPPDRILRQFGGVDGVLNGHLVVCTSPPDGTYSCREGAEAVQPFDAELAHEIEVLETYFAGPRPLYKATRAADGCYELRQVNPYPDPPYGSFSRFCFDAATGALARLERHITLATETIEAVGIYPDVHDADFDLSPDPEFAAMGSPSSGPPTTEAPFSPCDSGPRFRPDTCPDDRVFAACQNADERSLAVAELWRRRVSVNDARLGSGDCVAAYVRTLLERGYGPPAPG